ncbi:serine protease [Actinoplanes sp. L3-i22]|uniref:serine protease n=1 Tax=Actinoplanes sp. L3-i22 TaxID=2836373 RepID=UPI001C791103|nr:serine protease [Actinoplanes sp. L3-i22]BCY11746.1 hypothetical protein L3i22_068340 [Actinoplanes sp. L3-i22]
MPSGLELFSRVVEVICDRGEDIQEERWYAGTGTLTGSGFVLTCAHVIDTRPSATIKIRTIDGEEHAAAVELLSPADGGLDLALLRVAAGEFLPFLSLARIDRTRPDPVCGCWAVGFPRFGGRTSISGYNRQVRQTAQVWGYILPGSRMRGEPQLELMVTTAPSHNPGARSLVRSPWVGMSGAGVFVTGSAHEPRLIGVLSEHTVAAGASALAVQPLAAVRDLDDAADWIRLLGPQAAGHLDLALAGTLGAGQPNLFIQPLAEAAVRASIAVAPASATMPGQTVARLEADGQPGGPHPDLAYGLLARACEIGAAPAGESESGPEGLAKLLRSPQLATLLDQMVGRTLRGDGDEAGELLRASFTNMCDVLGVLPETDTRRGLFESMRAWVRILAGGLASLIDADRILPLYSADALRDQAEALLHYVGTEPATKAGEVLEHLREHVRRANARISLTMLGQNRSLPLTDIYVEPTLTIDRPPLEPHLADGTSAQGAADVAPYEQQAWSLIPRIRNTIDEDLLGMRGVRASPLRQITGSRSIVLGQPGIGKSTLSTKLSYDGSDPEWAREPVPFVVILRDLVSERERSRLSIVEFMESHARTDMQIGSLSIDALRYFLLGGDIHVIFDGLDEIVDPANYDWACRAIDNFCLEYRAARVTVTSRRHGFDGARFPTFTIYALSPFDPQQLSTYVQRWFKLDESLLPSEHARYAAEFIEQSEAADELRRIPLLLALMCSIFAVEGDIPSTLSEIYQKCAQLYFRDWDSRRRIRATEAIGRLPSSIIFEAFSALAASMLRDDSESRSGVTMMQLTANLRQFFQSRRVLDEAEEGAVAEAFADFVSGRAWLVDKVGRNDQGAVLYQFTHRTFLEYFAAEHAVRTLRNPADLAEFGLSALSAEGQIVVAQLVFQICGRARPDDVTAALAIMIDVASYTPLKHRIVAADFFATLLSAVPLERTSVGEVVKFCLTTAVSLGQMGSVAVWTANGYDMYESTNWFEYRSLGQAGDFNVDLPRELIHRLLSTGLHGIVSRAVFLDATRVALREVVVNRPAISVFLGIALRDILPYYQQSDFRSPEVIDIRKLTREVFDELHPDVESEARSDPSLAVMAVIANIITLESLIDWYGLSVLMLNPLNPLCEADYSIGHIAVRRVLSQAAMGREGEFMEVVFRRVAEGLDINRDLINYRDFLGVSSLFDRNFPDHADSTPEAISGAIALLMITREFANPSALVMPEGGNFPARFLAFWADRHHDASAEEVIENLGTVLPQKCVAVLVSLASRLQEASGSQRADFGGRRIRGPKFDSFRDGREFPYWLPVPDAGDARFSAAPSLALLRRLSDAGLGPYTYGLAHMVYVLGCRATDPREAVALLQEALDLQMRSDHSSADVAAACVRLANAYRRAKWWSEAEDAVNRAVEAFGKVLRPPHIYGSTVNDLVSDISRAAVAVVTRRSLRRNYDPLLNWIAMLAQSHTTNRPDVDLAAAKDVLLGEAERLRDRMLSRLIEQQFFYLEDED